MIAEPEAVGVWRDLVRVDELDVVALRSTALAVKECDWVWASADGVSVSLPLLCHGDHDSLDVNVGVELRRIGELLTVADDNWLAVRCERV